MEKYNDTHNKKHLAISNNNFVANDTGKVHINLVLENGEQLTKLIKKAQQQGAELKHTRSSKTM